MKLKHSYPNTIIDSINMASVKGGSFEIYTDHYITLPNYCICKYQVTVKEFAHFIDATGYITDADKKMYSLAYVRNNIKEKKESIGGVEYMEIHEKNPSTITL